MKFRSNCYYAERSSKKTRSFIVGLSKFLPFPISYCLLCLSMRFIGIVGGLSDPRTILDMHSLSVAMEGAQAR
jgi:hypothetical protein